VKVDSHRVKNIPFLAMDARFQDCRVLFAKVVGATSGEGFLVRN